MSEGMKASAAARGDPRASRERWRAPSRAVVACFLASVLLAFGGSFLMRWMPDLPTWARVGMALAPLPALAGIIVFGVRALATLDELERRIQAEALAIAFGVLGILLVTYGQLHEAGVLGPERWTMLWPLMWAAYCAGWAWAARRYR